MSIFDKLKKGNVVLMLPKRDSMDTFICLILSSERTSNDSFCKIESFDYTVDDSSWDFHFISDIDEIHYDIEILG